MTERYLLGELTSEEAAAFEEHFFECRICAADIRRANRLLANLKVEMRGRIPVVELNPDDRLVELTIRMETPTTSPVECECQCGSNTPPIVVTASPRRGLIRLQLRAALVSPGRCDVIVRDPRSRSELERHQFIIQKASVE